MSEETTVLSSDNDDLIPDSPIEDQGLHAEPDETIGSQSPLAKRGGSGVR
jgi:hypothetical protein